MAIDWDLIDSTQHFHLWGYIVPLGGGMSGSRAVLAINHGRGPHWPPEVRTNAVWQKEYESAFSICQESEEIAEAKEILRKFERLYPCHFLAKEYQMGDHNGNP